MTKRHEINGPVRLLVQNTEGYWMEAPDALCGLVAQARIGARREAAEELNEIKSYLIGLCKETCKDREGYKGKLRHVPNCPAHDLGLMEKEKSTK